MMNGYTDFAYVYDELNSDADYESRAAFLAKTLALNGIGGGILLDLACGTGTISLLMAQRGFSVIGVDGSEDMLAVARRKQAETEQDILFLQQDMTELNLFGTVDCAVCTLDSLNHILTLEELEKAIARVSLFLDDDGIFIFDVNTPFKHKEILANNTFVIDTDDVYCVWLNSTDNSTLITEIELDLFVCSDDGTYIRSGEVFAERGYEIEEISAILQRNELELLEIFDDCSFDKLKLNSQRATFVCKRRRRQKTPGDSI